eukprot:2952217-Pleurochrysis_carterae.AAC.2
MRRQCGGNAAAMRRQCGGTAAQPRPLKLSCAPCGMRDIFFLHLLSARFSCYARIPWPARRGTGPCARVRAFSLIGELSPTSARLAGPIALCLGRRVGRLRPGHPAPEGGEAAHTLSFLEAVCRAVGVLFFACIGRFHSQHCMLTATSSALHFPVATTSFSQAICLGANTLCARARSCRCTRAHVLERALSDTHAHVDKQVRTRMRTFAGACACAQAQTHASCIPGGFGFDEQPTLVALLRHRQVWAVCTTAVVLVPPQP